MKISPNAFHLERQTNKQTQKERPCRSFYFNLINKYNMKEKLSLSSFNMFAATKCDEAEDGKGLALTVFLLTRPKEEVIQTGDRIKW